MSHIFGMGIQTSARTGEIVLSTAEAEEYRSFKRQKRISEVWAALARSECEGAKRGIALAELKKSCDEAVSVHAAAVRVFPNFILPAKSFLGTSGVKVDCVVGGVGETLAKVKAYEAKRAVKNGANELTLILSPSFFQSGRTGELKREIKKVCRAARHALVKVVVEGERTVGELVKLAAMAFDCGAKFLSVAYFTGAENLKKELGDRCMLEVTGVEKAEDYKALALSGVERIGTTRGAEIYAALMREAENCDLEQATGKAYPTAFAEPVERKSAQKNDNKSAPTGV